MKLFNIIKEDLYAADSNKGNLAFIIDNPLESYSHLFGFFEVIANKLKEKYNLYLIGNLPNKSVHHYDLSPYVAVYQFNGSYYEDIKEGNMLRAKHEAAFTSEQRANWNQDIIKKEFDRCFRGLIINKVILVSDTLFKLPLQQFTSEEPLKSAYNEFHDYIGDDEEIKGNIKKLNTKICNNFYAKVSFLAFTQAKSAVFFTFLEYLNETGNLQNVYAFIYDPTLYTPFFSEKNIPLTCYYFAFDNRGTRHFKYFPIAELQHLVYDKKIYYKNIFNEEKTGDFLFIGSILQDKGSRKDMWEKYFQFLNVEKSALYIPLRMNGYITNQTGGKLYNLMKKAQEKESFLYDSIKNHPMYKGNMPAEKLRHELAKYKYYMVLRCVSKNDSLNYRIINALACNALPFLDEGYDPECLQVPKEYQLHLTVNSYKQIEERIYFYNNNDEYRRRLLKSMQDYYQINCPEEHWIEKIPYYF